MKARIGVITFKYIGGKAGLEQTNISEKHDIINGWGIVDIYLG